MKVRSTKKINLKNIVFDIIKELKNRYQLDKGVCLIFKHHQINKMIL